MRKVVIAVFVSLDGVMQAPGGPQEDSSGDFRFGGWTVPYWDDSVAESMGDLFTEPFSLLLGRRTYDIFAGHWPRIETDPSKPDYDAGNAHIARTFNEATKYVATHSPQSLAWQNSQWLGADVAATVRELRDGDGPRLLVQGSSELIHTLLEHGLIDELRLLVYPVVLGKGKKLFADGALPASLKLTSSGTSTQGVLKLRYEPGGEVRTGSFAMPDG